MTQAIHQILILVIIGNKLTQMKKEKNHILIQLEKLGMTKVILGIIKIYGIDIIK